MAMNSLTGAPTLTAFICYRHQLWRQQIRSSSVGMFRGQPPPPIVCRGCNDWRELTVGSTTLNTPKENNSIKVPLAEQVRDSPIWNELRYRMMASTRNRLATVREGFYAGLQVLPVKPLAADELQMMAQRLVTPFSCSGSTERCREIFDVRALDTAASPVSCKNSMHLYIAPKASQKQTKFSSVRQNF